jgi:hypothetical protein
MDLDGKAKTVLGCLLFLRILELNMQPRATHAVGMARTALRLTCGRDPGF